MESKKSKIIPAEMKAKIDEILEHQLFNANRYYAESNSIIKELMNRELYESPECFLIKLQERWNWHNSFYEELLEPAFTSLVKSDQLEMSPSEIDDLIHIFTTACIVDEMTLVMSGAIKSYLEYHCKLIDCEDENISVEESNNMLITPPVETFFAQYQIDHLYYIYLLKFQQEKVSEFRNMIIKKYHANDPEIFNNRFEKRYKNYLNNFIDEKELLEEIKSYLIPYEYKVKHLYFTLEHSDRKAIRDIILYDNLNEKMIASNLIGISGFLLRKKILEYLDDSDILKNDGYIYQYNKEIQIEGLKKLENERKKMMDKNVIPYKQRGDTCAIACMMMALEYFKVISKANWYDERRYYRIYGSRYMKGTPFSSLAFHFAKNGLDTKLYHEEVNLFSNDKNAMPDEDFNLAMDEYKIMLERAKLAGATVINGKNIDLSLIKKELLSGNLVILAGEIVGGYHAILISGYDQDNFIVCDPLYKEKQIRTVDEINKFMDTDIGKWFISVNNDLTHKKELLRNLDKFNNDAQQMSKIVKENTLRYEKK